jgi:hypothetical protein
VVIADIGPKPEASKDFDAAFKSLEEALDKGDITSEDYNAQYRALSREEGVYTAQITVWEQQEANRQRQVQEAATRAEQDWNTAAAAWEAEPANAEFLANPLRAKMLQESLEVVDRQQREAGKVLAPTALLNEAMRVTREALGLPPPATPADATRHQQTAVRDAVGQRQPPAVPATLADAPTAGREAITGAEGYDALDALGIEELEGQVANMSPASVEKYLRAAPGANANGHAVS